ncbi:MAG: antitermination protein NusB [Eggerthellaceae bacterium]|nr:antitermination protein NusB [Eggerthellaceae bacterium]
MTEPTTAADGESARDERRSWVPNRKQKPKKSKKEFDQKKMANLVDEDKPVYRGELDPRKKDPGRKPRSVSRSEEKLRAKAEKLAEEDPSLTSKKAVRITDFRDQFERCEASPGRLGALYATQQVRRRQAYAQEVIEATIDQSTISQQDRAFATLLTLGVVSTQGSLDEVINRCLASPRDIKPDVRDALRISTYEIIYLRKTPHAAVDQGVELVRAVAPSAAGLGNAVLHRILTAADSFPFGDPTKSIEALALVYAFPTWLARQLIEDMGAQAAIELMRASNDPAPLFIHVNALKAADEEIVALFKEAGAEIEPASAGGIESPGCYRISNSRVLTDGRIRRLFSQGKILVSDAAAQAVAACVLESGKPESVLEVGAGRGTKTIMLQSDAMRMFGEQVNMASMDSHAFKTELLRERAAEYGAEVSDIIVGNATRLDSVIPDRQFDMVFIDAPCSGLGTLRRHQDIRWRIEQDKIDELADTGLELLKSAASHVTDGGSIVYATCTVTYAENNGVVKRFLESDEGANFALATIAGKACFASKLTQGSPDAHFAAKFTKKRN